MSFDVGIVGCGFYGRFHIDSWRALASQGVRIAAVCDADAARAEATAAEFGARHWYSDAAEMFARERLDLVDIATRMASHKALVTEALGARMATIVQKPMASRLADCVEMVAAADNAGVFFAVHENFRFQRTMVRIAEIIASGEIGVPSWARIASRSGPFVYDNQPYFHDEERLIILDVGVHLIDLARVFLGEVAHVSCETQRRNDRVRAEDTATMLMRHAGGAVCIAECTFENQRATEASLVVEIEATRGGIATTPDGGLRVTAPDGERREPKPASIVPPDGPQLQYARESIFRTCKHMFESVRAGKTAATNGADNLKTFAVAEAAYEAAASGRAVAPVM